MQQPSTAGLDIGAIITGLGGGLALFLFGMRHMTDALTTVAGGSMKTLLARLTTNRFTGAIAGAVVTAVIQSSSVTTVLVVGFLTAGLMTFSQSVGVIIGANIGTTVTAQIVAFRIYQYGLLLIAIGFLVDVAARRIHVKQYGKAIMGLGLLFFGMQLMTGATGPLSTYMPFVTFMESLRNPLLAMLVGLVFTATVQSSSATTGLVIVFASESLITLETGIGMVLGANIGTCVTAVLSAFRRPREAVQAAGVHVVFNVLGAVIWLVLLPWLAGIVQQTAPGDVSRQIANAHTLFNVGNACLFIWFTGPLGHLVERIVPAIAVAPERGKPVYLDPYFISQPALALDRVRMELTRLSELVGNMLHDCLAATLSDRPEPIARLKQADMEINALHGAIVLYLAGISQQNLGDAQTQLTYENILIANYLESMGDVVDKNLMETARKRLRSGTVVSAPTARLLETLHDRVCDAFSELIVAIRSDDTQVARGVIRSKAGVNAAANQVMSHIAERLVAQEPNRLASFEIEADVVEHLKRLNNLTRRIARTLLRSPTDEARQKTATTSDQG